MTNEKPNPRELFDANEASIAQTKKAIAEAVAVGDFDRVIVLAQEAKNLVETINAAPADHIDDIISISAQVMGISRRGAAREQIREVLKDFDAEFILPPIDGWEIMAIFKKVDRDHAYVIPRRGAYQKNLSNWFKTNDFGELVESVIEPALAERNPETKGGWDVKKKGLVRTTNDRNRIK